LPPV